jgi:hypothetical protein
MAGDKILKGSVIPAKAGIQPQSTQKRTVSKVFFTSHLGDGFRLSPE